MRRTTFTVLVLAALCVIAACDAPAASATRQESPRSATAAHKKAQQPAKTAASHAAAHAAGRPTAHAAKQAAGQSSARKHAGSGAAHPASPRQPSGSRQTSRSRQPKSQPAAKPQAIGKSKSGAKVRSATRVGATLRSNRTTTPNLAAKVDQAAKLHPSAEPAQGADTEAPDTPAEPKVASLPKMRAAAMPPPLRGSFESLERQNEKTEADSLERIEDEDDLNDRIARKMLVPVPASAALTVNGNLAENHRYCRPWTASFLSDLARAHAAQFHRPLEVSSAVRTVEYQKRLMQTNGNAAAAEGDIASPHLTGATIDIAKQGMSRRELGWMRAWLLTLQKAGQLDVEEEFQQLCFHITVYKSYVPARPPRKVTNPARAAKTTAPATAGPTQAIRRKPGQPKPAQPRQPASEPLPAAAPATATAEGL